MFNMLLEALRATGIAFEDMGWAVAPGTDYGTASLDGQGATIWADDQVQEQAISGTVDLFTRDAGRTQMAAVQAALNSCGICWRLNSIQYEEDTRLTHYEWAFELEAV